MDICNITLTENVEKVVTDDDVVDGRVVVRDRPEPIERRRHVVDLRHGLPTMLRRAERGAFRRRRRDRRPASLANRRLVHRIIGLLDETAFGNADRSVTSRLSADASGLAKIVHRLLLLLLLMVVL